MKGRRYLAGSPSPPPAPSKPPQEPPRNRFCKRNGCFNEVPPPPPNSKPRDYCSDKCANAARQGRVRDKVPAKTFSAVSR
jgi:hypothetical protein